MSNSNKAVVNVDQFAGALEEILGNIEQVSEESLNASVKDGVKASRDEWKAKAPVRTGKYQKSIRIKIDRKGREPEAHAYSTMPGLPHLLEKGHATLGGGRTKAYPHVAPAAEKGFKEAYESLQRRIGSEL